MLLNNGKLLTALLIIFSSILSFQAKAAVSVEKAESSGIGPTSEITKTPHEENENTTLPQGKTEISPNTNLTPKEALTRLREGNDRFVKDDTICPNRHQDRRTITYSKQRPFAVILGCSDSRVPPELAFDQGIGDIFVVRVAGNVVGETELDSVEYSVIHNHSVIVVVLGHENCGAVGAVLDNNTKDIKTIAKLIEPVVKQKQNLTSAVEANIKNSVNRIKRSPPIAKLIKEGKVDVVGAYYDLKTGEVSFNLQ